MAWTENYLCDVCGRAKHEDQHDWWLALVETMSHTPGSPEQPVLRVTPWHDFISHASGVLHLCGARCVQTELDRWMTASLEEVQAQNQPLPPAES
jgi:hypothetical protein